MLPFIFTVHHSFPGVSSNSTEVNIVELTIFREKNDMNDSHDKQ